MRDRDRARFIDLANKRVSRLLKSIQLVGNLSNRSNYDYTEDDVAKIFRAIQHELAVCKKRFDLALKRQNDSSFSLE